MDSYCVGDCRQGHTSKILASMSCEIRCLDYEGNTHARITNTFFINSETSGSQQEVRVYCLEAYQKRQQVGHLTFFVRQVPWLC